MNEPKFKVGDHFKRSDFDDGKIYAIDKISKSKGEWIYGAEGQGWTAGWAWISEANMMKVMT